MKSEGHRKVQKYIKQKRAMKQCRRLAALLCSVMVFCVTYALILPAITLETDGCVIPEHTHDISCYTQLTLRRETALACTAESLGVHVHGEACLDETGSVVCRRADFVVHEHDGSCLDESGGLRCPLPEIKAHTHGEGCFVPAEVHTHSQACVALERGELPCALAETAGHTHDESCYTTEPVLCCSLPESEGHRHALPCFDNQGALLCPLEETDGHSHGQSCWQEQTVLVCLLTEEAPHIHTDDCYAQTEYYACGLEETELPAEPVLVCTEPEIVLHTHTEECLDETGGLLCTKTEIVEHIHGENCFAAVDVPLDTTELTCPLNEEGHEHGELCYGLWELTCSLTEHTHDELCTPPTAIPEPTAEPTPEPGYAVLAADEAYVAELRSTGGQLLTESGEERMPLTVKPGERVAFSFALTTGSYTGAEYGHGRVKLEFILPVGEEQAVFDATALPWADDSQGYAPGISWETRVMGAEAVNCQVLTAWYALGDEAGESAAIPGPAEAAVVVEVRDMAPGESLGLIVRAAMEHNTWEGLCEMHQREEILSVATEQFTVLPLRDEEEIREQRDALAAEVAALEVGDCRAEEVRQGAEALLERIREVYQQGELSDGDYLDYTERLELLLSGDLATVAEPAVGTNWMLLRDSGWFESYGNAEGTVAVAAPPPVEAAAPLFRSFALNRALPPSSVQVEDEGGTNTSPDGAVTVSKTIAGTELENVFDITLDVRTTIDVQEISREPDMAVVIVMDISNTMKSDFSGDTDADALNRYEAAMDAAESFLYTFADSNTMGISKVGYVAFNTSAHKIADLQPCTDRAQAEALVADIRNETGVIINPDSYASSNTRFTNIEAGLALGADMLSQVDNENKFIIFLSDGFPTTYINPDAGEPYQGYDPNDTTGVRFKDRVLNKPCRYGTSYSDEAAIRAREMATAIKASGITIYSIGVDVGGQTVQWYIDQFNDSPNLAVVDRTGETYEIGSADDEDAYKYWLGHAIGSGYYYDSEKADQLSAAYDAIIGQIKTEIEQGTVADWVTADPLPTLNGVADTVEFIGFYTKTPELTGDALVGSYVENGENTASYDEDSSSIYWDLKNSGYSLTSTARQRAYEFELVYRVRLKNEEAAFVERDIYPTNDPTTLQYRTVLSNEGMLTRSVPLTVDYPIPSVFGYLADLTFAKRDAYGGALAGAEFTLLHDEENCRICRGDGNPVTIDGQVAVSQADGSVSFHRIPSGHRYTLTETKVPEGFSPSGDKYAVEVAYDELTVTVTAYDGAAKEWEGVVVNHTYYELPATGGRGTAPFVLSGLALAVLSGGLLLMRARRRRTN